MSKMSITVSLLFVINFLQAQESALTPPSIIKGPWKEKLLRQQWYYPYGNPTPEYFEKVKRELKNIATEETIPNTKVSSITSWQNIGPTGILPVTTSSLYTGRVTDVEYVKPGTFRVLSASGGLWQIDTLANNSVVYHSLSDQLDCNTGGAFATDPTNSDIIFLGTGEGGLTGGCGLWKTTDAGLSWAKLTLAPEPSKFYELIIINNSPLKLYAATDLGLYQSDDGGVTWTRTKQGEITDVVVNPTNTNNIVVAQWNSGFYRSTDGGVSFTKNLSAPTVNVGRTALDIALSVPSTIYANVTNNTNNNTKGIYKSTDDGNTWTACVLGNDINGNPSNGDFHSGQGWYNNSIGVHPTDPNLVIAGGVTLWRSTDGNIFNEVDGRHVDQHAVSFASNNWVIIGNDGGIFISKNKGYSFNTINSATNVLPITQFVDCAVSHASAATILGGTQDNGTVFHTANVPAWTTTQGDGGGVAADPYFEQNLYTAVGVYSGAQSFHRLFSTNGGMSWQDKTAGMDPNGQWYPPLRVDYGTGGLYTCADKYLYRTFDYGATWEKVNPSNPFAPVCGSFSIDQSGASEPSIYAISGTKIKVRDRNTLTWVTRNGTIPTLNLKQIQADFVLQDRAFVCVSDISTNAAGNKIFLTDDIGITWTNITGNLPNIPILDILPSPINPNIYYIATTEGGFKTIDGGVSWVKWAFGFPKRVEVTKLDYIDSTAINGKFYILASTYGRGLWLRDVSGDDPLSVVQNGLTTSGISNLVITPNPISTEFMLNFVLSKPAPLTITLMNITGAVVKTIIPHEYKAGAHHIPIHHDGSNGIYFLRLETPWGMVTKRMVKM